MIELRPGQDEVAEYRSGYMAVPAVPGAGKTTVLAYLAADLIGEGAVGNDKLLVVTYMNSAVANFRSRIGDYLEERGLSRNRGYEVRTLHSLALNILKEKPENLLINGDFRIMDPGMKGRLIRNVLDQWLSNNQKRSLKYFSYFPGEPGYNRAVDRWKEQDFYNFIKTMIGYFKLNGIDRERSIELKSQLGNDSYLSWALTIFAKYDRILHEEGMLDFDDMIIQSLKLLKSDHKLQKRLSSKYSYVFEDEAQDSNRVLSEILQLLAGEDGNLVRVGDSNQSIMGTFTSADPEVFRSFIRRDKVEEKGILYSSRSTEDIINLANQLVNWISKKHPEKMCRVALENKYINPVADDDPAPNPVTEGYTIGYNTFSTSKEEIEEIAAQAASYIKNNPDQTMGLLVPSNYVIEKLAENLDNLDIEYEKVSNRLGDKANIIFAIRSAVNYLAEPQNVNYLQTCFEKLLIPYYLEIDEENLVFYKKIFHTFSIEKVFYPIGGREVKEREFLDDVPEKYQDEFTEVIEELRYWIDASVKLPPDELILFLAEQMNLSEEELAVAQNMALIVKSELNLHPHWKLKDIADEFTRLQDTFEQFARKIYDRKGFKPQEGVITITTMHKAKGLEWDTVFLMYLTDDNYPSTVEDRFRGEYYYLKDEYSNPKAMARAELDYLLGDDEDDDPKHRARIEHINERLRLLYVGLTRAEKNLFLSAHKKIIYDNGSREVDEALPYRFLQNYIREERSRYADR